MRGRRLKKAGRRAALFMAFMMAFSATSTYTVQTVEAAVSSVDVRMEEELGGMLSVGTVVRDDWKYDGRLQELLTRRDLEAAEYARENNITGTYNTSGSLGSFGTSDTSAEWLSNVLYQGDILRSDTFDGFIAVYNGGADAAVIEDGINEIDVLLIPISDLQVSANGIETDISTWETIPGFASRFMLPHWNGQDGLSLKHKTAYRTKLFVVGIQGGMLSKGSIYDKDGMLDYAKYLDYIGAEPSAANLASYTDYMRVYESITKGEDQYRADRDEWNEWYEWYENTRRDGSRSTGDRGSSAGEPDRPSGGITPVSDKKGRTIMIYLDGGNLGDSAAFNLHTMLTASKDGSIGSDNHIVILTGGSNKAWTGSDGYTIKNYLYDTNGEQQDALATSIGTKKQLWELRDGRLTLIQDGFNDNGYMTQGSNLAAFIKAVKSKYPDASMYDLIMWDHGGGPEGGFGMDEGRDDDQSMSLVDMTNAIRESGVDFDFIAFDACLMGNAEVALAFSPYAQYLMLSEQEFPGRGLNEGYANIISELIDKQDIATTDYAQKIIESTIGSYDRDADDAHDAHDAIMSLIESAKVQHELADAIAGFAGALKDVVERNDQDTLDIILRIRKSYTYTEVKSNDSYKGDLIDVQGFCTALMDSYDGRLKKEDAKLYDACKTLKAAAKSCIFSKKIARGMDRDLAQGTEPTGLSMYFPTFSMTVTPIGQLEGDIDQVLDLISAYKSSDGKLDSYGQALAAYGLWLKAGKLLGGADAWMAYDETTDAEDVWRIGQGNGTSHQWSINDLYEASGLTKEQADRLIESQIKDRIKKANITVTNITDENDSTKVTGKTVTVMSGDPYIVDRVEAKIYVGEGADKVSLGRSNMYATEVERTTTGGAAAGTATSTISPYDNKWLVMGGRVVSYYDTEIRSLTDANGNETNYRVGIIPVAYWMEKWKGDDTDSTLEAAIYNGKVMVGVLEIRFPYDETDKKYRDTGYITDFRRLNDNSIATSGYSIADGEIYELLAGFDKGNDTSSLRSIGVIKAENKNMETATFSLIDDLNVEYSIVDAYEARYELNSDNFRDEDDTRNIGNFKADMTDEVGVAPVPSIYTVNQGDLEGTYSDRDTKSADVNAANATDADETVIDTADDSAATAADSSVDETTAAEGDEAGIAGTDGAEEGTSPVDASAVTITTAQQTFLANIAAALQNGTITLQQAAALIGEAGIAPEQVDAYTAGTAVIDDGPAVTDTAPEGTADPAMAGQVPAASDPIAAASVTDPVSDPALIAADPAAVITADPAAVTEPAATAATDPVSVTGIPAATGLDGSEPAADVSSSYVDAAPPEESAYTGDDSGSGDIGSGDGGSDGGSSDSGSDSGSDDGGSDDGGSSDSSEGDSE